MILKVKTSADVPASEITPEAVYRSRREFIKVAAAGTIGMAAGSMLAGERAPLLARQDPFASAKKSPLSVDEHVDPRTSYEKITTYNNYYEFFPSKDQPAKTA